MSIELQLKEFITTYHLAEEKTAQVNPSGDCPSIANVTRTITELPGRNSDSCKQYLYIFCQYSPRKTTKGICHKNLSGPKNTKQ